MTWGRRTHCIVLRNKRVNFFFFFFDPLYHTPVSYRGEEESRLGPRVSGALRCHTRPSDRFSREPRESGPERPLQVRGIGMVVVTVFVFRRAGRTSVLFHCPPRPRTVPSLWSLGVLRFPSSGVGLDHRLIRDKRVEGVTTWVMTSSSGGPFTHWRVQEELVWLHTHTHIYIEYTFICIYINRVLFRYSVWSLIYFLIS